jgi:hypothetical protein
VGSFFSTSSTLCATSEEWAVPHPLVPPVVLLLKREECEVPPPILSPVVLLLNCGSSFSTSSTRRVASEEWAVSPPLVAPVVFLLKSGQFLLH